MKNIQQHLLPKPPPQQLHDGGNEDGDGGESDCNNRYSISDRQSFIMRKWKEEDWGSFVSSSLNYIMSFSSSFGSSITKEYQSDEEAYQKKKKQDMIADLMKEMKDGGMPMDIIGSIIMVIVIALVVSCDDDTDRADIGYEHESEHESEARLFISKKVKREMAKSIHNYFFALPLSSSPVEKERHASKESKENISTAATTATTIIVDKSKQLKQVIQIQLLVHTILFHDDDDDDDGGAYTDDGVGQDSKYQHLANDIYESIMNRNKESPPKPSLVSTTKTNKQFMTFWKLILQHDIHHYHDSHYNDDEKDAQKAISIAEMHNNVITNEDNNKHTTGDAEMVKLKSEQAATTIYDGAKFVRDSLSTHFVPNVTSGIEALGEFAKRNIAPNPSDENADERDDCIRGDDDGNGNGDGGHGASSNNNNNIDTNDDNEEDQVLKLTNSTVQATDTLRESTKFVAHGIRNYSTKGINTIKNKWEEKELGKELIADDDLREVTVAAGRVGVATVGASAVVVESIFETTKAVLQTSVKVAADVAQHKYGGNAGKQVQGTGDAVGNILSSMTHVASLQGQVLTKVVARDAAKSHMDDAAKHDNSTTLV
jgi:hypothetical protein